MDDEPLMYLQTARTCTSMVSVESRPSKLQIKLMLLEEK